MDSLLWYNGSSNGSGGVPSFSLESPNSTLFYCNIMWNLSTLTLVSHATSLIFGVISWMLIKEWGNFQNYVFLNVILATFLITIIDNFNPEQTHVFAVMLVNWLIVFSLVFGMDINNPEYQSTRYRYKVVNMFGWLLSLAETMLAGLNFFFFSIYLCLLIVLTIINVIMLLKTLLTVIKLIKAQKYSTACKKVLIANISLVLSSLLVFMVAVCLLDIGDFMYPYYYTMKCSCLLFDIFNCIFLGINLTFLSMKSHRKLWIGYLMQQNVRKD